MLLLRLTLRLPIARHTRHRPAYSTLHTIRHPLAQITQLSLRLLRLTLCILLLACLLEILVADQAAESFFGAADCLVPAAGLAVWVVGCDSGGGDRDAADAGAGFGEVVFSCCFGFLVFGCLFVGGVAGEAADGGLDCAACLRIWMLVDVVKEAVGGVRVRLLPSRCTTGG